MSARLALYVFVNFVLVLGAAFAILFFHHAMARTALVVSSVAVLASLVAFGALFEGKSWARPFEGARLVLGAVAIFAVVTTGCRRKHDDVKVVTIEGASTVLPAAAAVAPAVEIKSEPRSIVVDGGTRKWLLVEPRTIDPGKRHALVLVLHGDGGNARGFHSGFPFEKASGDGAILAYLDGLRATWDLETPKGRNRDVLFAKQVVEQLLSERPIDRDRVFAVGYSSGGFLANVIACHEPGLLRAISSSAGGAPYKQAEQWPNGYPKCPGQTPTAMIALHGERDFGVTIDSGRFSASYWAYVNGCNTAEMETTGYKECTAYRGCRIGKPVAWCDVPDLDHWVWSRAAEASWTFFERVSAGEPL